MTYKPGYDPFFDDVVNEWLLRDPTEGLDLDMKDDPDARPIEEFIPQDELEDWKQWVKDRDEEMEESRLSPTDQIANAVALYGAGIICPGVVWDTVEYAIDQGDTNAVLNSCLLGVQHHLRKIFHDRPWETRKSNPELAAAVRQWCLYG